MKNQQMNKEIEKMAKKLHEWYLEACQKPESGMDFNPAAQEPYENLKETQKFLDRYIAEKVLSHTQAVEERVENILQNLKFNWEEKALGDMIVVKILQALNKPQ